MHTYIPSVYNCIRRRSQSTVTVPMGYIFSERETLLASTNGEVNASQIFRRRVTTRGHTEMIYTARSYVIKVKSANVLCWNLNSARIQLNTLRTTNGLLSTTVLEVSESTSEKQCIILPKTMIRFRKVLLEILITQCERFTRFKAKHRMWTHKRCNKRSLCILSTC